jgi:hypothetical protein
MRFLRRLFAVVAVLALLGGLALSIALDRATPKPPIVQADMKKPGPGHAERAEDIWFIWVSGAPEVRGADMQRLVGPVMRQIDETMHKTFAEVIPSAPLRFVIEIAGRLFGRHLSQDIPVEIQREIVGQMASYDDPFGDGGGKFARFMAYLALHDLAQTVEKSPLVACTGFGFDATMSASGGTVVGRNFDFEAGRVFDEQKSVTLIKPEHGYQFLSVAWPGMNGVVTGVNEKRVWVSVNAARSDFEAPRGIPVSLAIRQVLEHAASAEEAVERIKTMPVRVADLYLVADKAHVYVVEKTPKTSVVRSAENGRIVVANHFLDPELRAEKRNLQLERKTSSLVRYERMSQLVVESGKKREPADAVAMLRDRIAPDGTPYPLGDRRALDGYIATHGAFADFGKDVLWVSRAPHLSGKWTGVKLGPLFEGRFERAEPMPEDPVALEGGKAIGWRSPGK